MTSWLRSLSGGGGGGGAHPPSADGATRASRPSSITCEGVLVASGGGGGPLLGLQELQPARPSLNIDTDPPKPHGDDAFIFSPRSTRASALRSLDAAVKRKADAPPAAAAAAAAQKSPRAGGALSPTTVLNIEEDDGFDDEGLNDHDFTSAHPLVSIADGASFMDAMLSELRAAGASKAVIESTLAATTGSRLHILSANDILDFERLNKSSRETLGGRVTSEIYMTVGGAPFRVGEVIDPRGVDLAHFPVQEGAHSHLYGHDLGRAPRMGDKGRAPVRTWVPNPTWSTQFTIPRVVSKVVTLVALTLLCATGWYMLAVMNILNYGPVFTADAAAATGAALVMTAGALRISDLFPFVAGPREGGISRSNEVHIKVVSDRIALFLKSGARVFRIASATAVETAILVLERDHQQEGAQHFDIRVPFNGRDVRVHVLTLVKVRGCSTPVTVMIVASQHRCMFRMWWVALQIAAADLAFHSLLGRVVTAAQVAAVFKATRTAGGLTDAEQTAHFDYVIEELDDADRARLYEYKAANKCDLLTALHCGVFCGSGARRYLELVVLEKEGELSEKDAKELGFRRMGYKEGRIAVRLAKKAKKLEVETAAAVSRASKAKKLQVGAAAQTSIDVAWAAYRAAAAVFMKKKRDTAAVQQVHRIAATSAATLTLFSADRAVAPILDAFYGVDPKRPNCLLYVPPKGKGAVSMTPAQVGTLHSAVALPEHKGITFPARAEAGACTRNRIEHAPALPFARARVCASHQQ